VSIANFIFFLSFNLFFSLAYQIINWNECRTISRVLLLTTSLFFFSQKGEADSLQILTASICPKRNPAKSAAKRAGLAERVSLSDFLVLVKLSLLLGCQPTALPKEKKNAVRFKVWWGRHLCTFLELGNVIVFSL
jgi:hypothetical protein